MGACLSVPTCSICYSFPAVPRVASTRVPDVDVIQCPFCGGLRIDKIGASEGPDGSLGIGARTASGSRCEFTRRKTLPWGNVEACHIAADALRSDIPLRNDPPCYAPKFPEEQR